MIRQPGGQVGRPYVFVLEDTTAVIIAHSHTMLLLAIAESCTGVNIAYKGSRPCVRTNYSHSCFDMTQQSNSHPGVLSLY